jgi:hypothetical protein
MKTSRGSRSLYEGIAETMRLNCPDEPERTGAYGQWEQDCKALAAFFAAGSRAFDTELFLRNCGVKSEARSRI